MAARFWLLRSCIVVSPFLIFAASGPPSNPCLLPYTGNITLAFLKQVAGCIQKMILSISTTDDEGLRYYPLVPGCIRLGFHSSLGSKFRAYVDLTDPHNNGLAITVSTLNSSYIKGTYMGRLSLSDMYAFCAVIAVEEATKGAISLNFRYGRQDVDPALVNKAEYAFPSRQFTMNESLDFFSKYNCTDSEVVALMGGGHSLGVIRNGPTIIAKWVGNPVTLSNLFFQQLMDSTLKWTQRARKYIATPGYPVFGWERLNLAPPYAYRLMFDSDMATYKDSLLQNVTTGQGGCPYSLCPLSVTAGYVQQYASNSTLFGIDFAKCYTNVLEYGYAPEDLLQL